MVSFILVSSLSSSAIVVWLRFGSVSLGRSTTIFYFSKRLSSSFCILICRALNSLILLINSFVLMLASYFPFLFLPNLFLTLAELNSDRVFALLTLLLVCLLFRSPFLLLLSWSRSYFFKALFWLNTLPTVIIVFWLLVFDFASSASLNLWPIPSLLTLNS